MTQSPKNNSAGNTSSSGQKQSSNGSVLLLLLIVFACYFLYNYYADWVHEKSIESAQQLEAEVLQTTAQFKNADGYVNEGDVEAYQQAAYKCVLAYEGGRIKTWGMTNNGVWVKFDDGFTMFVEPPMEEYLGADTSGSCTVSEYKPHEFSSRCDPYVELIDGNGSIFAERFSDGYAELYAYSDVRLATIKRMGIENTQQIILWFGHGAYDSEDGSFLFLGEKIDLSLLKGDNKYLGINVNMLAYSTESKQIGINAKFIKKYVKDLDGALVYLGACESGYDSRLADAFIDAGADTVICYDRTVRVTYHAELSRAFTEAMCTRDADGHYPSVSEAMATATSQVGANDSVKGGIGAIPVIYGSTSYSFWGYSDDDDSGGSDEGTSTTEDNGSSADGSNTGDSGGSTGDGGGPGNSASDFVSGAEETGNGGSSSGTTTDTSNSNSDDANTTENGSTGDSSSDGEQTAPMPEQPIQEDQIIGVWSPDVNAEQPKFIEFFYENGQLRYYYYFIVAGDGSGFNIANETTEFEINSGYVDFYGNQGRCSCVIDGTDGKVGVAFYLFDIDSGVIQDQETGEPFYLVE